MTVSVLFFDSLIGYTLAKFTFRGRNVVFIAILTTLMIPTEMLIIPWYLMAKNFGWLNTYWGIMFPGMMTGFGVFLMRQFFAGVPDDYIHAARIDGSRRIPDLVEGRAATCHAGSLGARHLYVPGQLDCFPLAADRHQQSPALHIARRSRVLLG